MQEIYTSREGRASVVVSAGEEGIQVEVAPRADGQGGRDVIFRTDWPHWLLIMGFTYGVDERGRRNEFFRACAALPEGDPS